MPYLRIIRVLVVDDSAQVCLALSKFLDVFEDLQQVGVAVNGQEAVLLCAQLQPDVVLMDVHMPVMDGLAATRMIVLQYPHIQVVILTNSPGTSLEQALEAGARAVIRKKGSIDTLAEAIRAAAA